MTIGDEQTIYHFARFNRVATGSTDDAAGVTGDWEPAFVGLRLGGIGLFGRSAVRVRPRNGSGSVIFERCYC